ncbi:MAG: type II toxin-antitoxin system prevent-host-death family antitoxin [Kiritimatiellaeota bacterium]|nr:type II toxin-antitoxin system prevent-host-death family antitoxin [Kiritimatiellota bacterium]
MTLTIAKAKQNLDELVETVSNTRTRVKIRGKKNSVFLISQAELDGIIATAELSAIPGMVESILKARKAPPEEFVSLEDFDWDAL